MAPTTTAPAAQPVAPVLDAITALVTAGFTAQTCVDTYRGAREVIVWREGATPRSMGPNATVRVQPGTGRVSGATVQPRGESGPTETVRGEAATLAALHALG